MIKKLSILMLLGLMSIEQSTITMPPRNGTKHCDEECQSGAMFVCGICGYCWLLALSISNAAPNNPATPQPNQPKKTPDFKKID